MSGGAVPGGDVGAKAPDPSPQKEKTQSQDSTSIPETSVQSLLLEGAVPGVTP